MRRAAIWLVLLTACARPSPPVDDKQARWVVVPTQIAALEQGQSSQGVPAQVRFGGAFGRSALFLKFADDWRAHGVPTRAFLTLSVREGAPVEARAVAIEAWRVSGAWQPEALVRWSDKPSLAPPYARAERAPSDDDEWRIDVSELVRFAAENPERDFGLALIASGGPGHGASFATGMRGGRAPRLELFVR